MEIIVGALFILYYLYLKIYYGGLSFSEFFVALAIVLILYRFTKDKLKENITLHKILKTITILGLTIFIITESILILYPKSNTKVDSDYMIILGAAVKGTTPSLTLKSRLDTALEYLNTTNDDTYIVVSGGQGNGENISEAQAMKTYLVQKGIEDKKIIMEDKSTSTYENFKYSKEKIESHSNNNIKELDIKVVTTDFHSFRSNLLARRNGYDNITFYTSKSKLEFIPTYYTREFFALMKTLVFD